MLKNKKVILGVCASIAAYKAALLVRLLVKEGAEVQVIMTKEATHFITPLTLSTLSGREVLIHFEKNEGGLWNNHVELGLWADLMLIAPASANTLSKMANGLCDNLLLATYLSARCEVYFAPAMDLDMYAHPATQNNINQLTQYGNTLVHPEVGELASGLSGLGRMREPEKIISFLRESLSLGLALKNKKALVTAGPTFESIDPVRFVGNHSSGKMGFAIAESLRQRGAEVTLITGPTNELIHHNDIRRIDVVSAEEMYKATTKEFKQADIAVMSAAVADYTPQKVAITKIKKSGDELVLKLKKTKDILVELGQAKNKKQILVGFALETDNEFENAKKKLKAKNLDFIVVNSLRNSGAGFKVDTNQVSIIDREQEITHFDLKSKQEVAADIVSQIVELTHA